MASRSSWRRLPIDGRRGAGVCGYPLDRAGAVAVGAVAKALRSGVPLDRVTFVLFSADTLKAFEPALTAFP